MAMLSIYLRVLGQLGPEKRLGVYLALANLFLAVAAFAEPVLFGKIIDVLTRLAGTGAKPTWPELMPLMLGWVGFGIFTILAGVYVALHADRLAHRRRLAVMARQLGAMGAAIEEFEDGMTITGGRALQGTVLDSETDHRVAMSLAVAATIATGDSQLHRPEAAAVSYPGFWDDLARLRA